MVVRMQRETGLQGGAEPGMKVRNPSETLTGPQPSCPLICSSGASDEEGHLWTLDQGKACCLLAGIAALQSLQSRLQPRDFLTGLTTRPPAFAFLLPGHKATIPRDIKIPRTLFASHSLTHRPAIPPDLLRHLSLYFIELGLIEKKSLCIFLSNIPRLIINSPFVPRFDILKFWVILKKKEFLLFMSNCH